MALLGNAVQLNKFSLAQCGVVGRKHDLRKARGERIKLFILIGWGERDPKLICKIATAIFSGYEVKF